MSHFPSALLVLALLASPARAETTLTYAWPANVGPLNPHLYAPNQMFAQNRCAISTAWPAPGWRRGSLNC